MSFVPASCIYNYQLVWVATNNNEQYNSYSIAGWYANKYQDDVKEFQLASWETGTDNS